MTPYYIFNKATSSARGPVGEDFPKFDYGFPPDGPSEYLLDSAQRDHEQRIFNYMESKPSIQVHESLCSIWEDGKRVVEGVDFLWQHQHLGGNKLSGNGVWLDCNKITYDFEEYAFRRLYAIPMPQPDIDLPAEADNVNRYSPTSSTEALSGVDVSNEAPGYTTADSELPNFGKGSLEERAESMWTKILNMDFQTLLQVFKAVSLIDLSDCTFEYIEEDGYKCINAMKGTGAVIDAISFNGNIFLMMNNDGSFDPLNPMYKSFEVLAGSRDTGGGDSEAERAQILVDALRGLMDDIRKKPNDTRYATHMKIAEEALKQYHSL